MATLCSPAELFQPWRAERLLDLNGRAKRNINHVLTQSLSNIDLSQRFMPSRRFVCLSRASICFTLGLLCWHWTSTAKISDFLQIALHKMPQSVEAVELSWTGDAGWDERRQSGTHEMGRAEEEARQKQRRSKMQLPSKVEAAWKNNCWEETEESH